MVGRLNPNWIVPTAPRGTSDSRAASTAFVTGGGAGPRKVLSGATTFYVASNGSDANDGLTSGTPWATLAHSLAVIYGQIDTGGNDITLQAVAGHANFTEHIEVKSWTGGGNFTFDGGGGTLTYVSNSAATPFGFDGVILVTGVPPGVFTYKNVTLISTTGTAPNNSLLQVLTNGRINQGSGVVLGACNGTQLRINEAAGFIMNASFSVTGSAAQFLLADGGAFISGVGPGASGINISFPNSISYSSTILSQKNSEIFLGLCTFSLGGGVTVSGSRFLAATGGVIDTGGKQTLNPQNSFIPGTTDGAIVSGGVLV